MTCQEVSSLAFLETRDPIHVHHLEASEKTIVAHRAREATVAGEG
jgi:hypothetical protein